jgi:glycosyltransferase involved in cell wall biosynthesis
MRAFATKSEKSIAIARESTAGLKPRYCGRMVNSRPTTNAHPDHRTPFVSVIVAARNGAEQLPVLFDALRRQNFPREAFEVIVVDDASDDGTEGVAAASGIARAIRCDTRVGLPRARTVGIRAAKGELIAITDADVVPDPDWLERGVARTRETGADILGGRITIALGDTPSIAALVDAMNWFNQEACVKQGFVLGGTLWAPRTTFDRWGLLSEEIEAYGHEDAEWGQRATSGGARIAYAPDVHLTHPPRTRMRDVSRKAYGLGFGLAPHRRIPHSTIRNLPPLFLRPTPFLPPRRIALNRLRELGQNPTRLQTARIYLSQWVFVELPKIAGDLMGELKYARTHRRRPAGHAVAEGNEPSNTGR